SSTIRPQRRLRPYLINRGMHMRDGTVRGGLLTLLTAVLVAACGQQASSPGDSSSSGAQASDSSEPKPASSATIAANKALADYLNFSDKQDFEDATKGLVDAPETLTIKNDKGDVVWDMESYKKYIGIDKAAPDTVNPSLWRNAQLNMQYGLFKVTDHIY